MRIFVTGANGFIGNNLMRKLFTPGVRGLLNIQALWSENDKWLTPQSFVYRRQDMLSALEQAKPDVLIHLAANPLVKTDSARDLLEVNTQLTADLMKRMPITGHVVFASSGTVYGDATGVCTELSPTVPTSAYGCSKLASENIIRAYWHTRQVSSTIFRFIANVGPFATHGVLKDLKEKYIWNPKLEVLGDRPGSTKPYIHVEDTIAAIVLAMTKREPDWGYETFLMNDIYNVSNSNPITVEKITELIMENYETKKEIVWLGEKANWKGDNRFVDVDSTKLTKEGWVRQYDGSEEAIRAALRK